MTQQKRSLNVLYPLAVLLLLAGGCNVSGKNVPTTPQKQSGSEQPLLEENGWQSYRNVKLGFELMYPPSWKIQSISTGDGILLSHSVCYPEGSDSSSGCLSSNELSLKLYVTAVSDQLAQAFAEDTNQHGSLTIASSNASREVALSDSNVQQEIVRFLHQTELFTVTQQWILHGDQSNLGNDFLSKDAGFRMLNQILTTIQFTSQ